jgi:hypothetical protein
MSEPFPVSAADLLRWAETLSGIARTGLGFTQSLYERERFEEVLKVAADIRAAALEEAESDALFEEWLATVGDGVAGYVTPKVAVAAVVGNEAGGPTRGSGSIPSAGRTSATRRPRWQ